jgi:hypothetical protein
VTRNIDVSISRPVPAAIIRNGIQEVFVNRLWRAKNHVRKVVLISPWITAVPGKNCAFTRMVSLLRSRRIPAYIFTRPPDSPSHAAAVAALRDCPTAELLYNNNIHAKIYACLAPTPRAFAILGSANLTANSLDLYEIGLLVLGVGPGASLVDDLSNFGLRYIRTRPESDVIQKIDPRALRNVL